MWKVPYMDAPTLPSFQSMRAFRIRLHPYIRIFTTAVTAVPDGMSGLAPNRIVALEVLGTFWVSPPRSYLFCHHCVLACAIGGVISCVLNVVVSCFPGYGAIRVGA